MDLIRELWRGNVPLSITFWRFGVGVSLLLNAALLYAQFQPDILTTVGGLICFLLTLLFSIIYSPFILIAIWRSANKYQGLQRYAVLAKIMVISGWGNYFRSLAEFAKEFPG